jgi:anti-anti-sigma regulatory factor
MQQLQAVAFCGDLDMTNLSRTMEELEQIEGAAVIDVSTVGFLDASTIAAFIGVARRLGPGQLQFRGASPQMRRIIDLLGVTWLFTFVD